MLKASARNSSLRFSAKGKDLKRDISTFWNLPPRRMLRPALPKVKTAGVTKALVLNQQLAVPAAAPPGHEPALGSPTRFRRFTLSHHRVVFRVFGPSSGTDNVNGLP